MLLMLRQPPTPVRPSAQRRPVTDGAPPYTSVDPTQSGIVNTIPKEPTLILARRPRACQLAPLYRATPASCSATACSSSPNVTLPSSPPSTKIRPLHIGLQAIVSSRTYMSPRASLNPTFQASAGPFALDLVAPSRTSSRPCVARRLPDECHDAVSKWVSLTVDRISVHEA